MERAGRLGGNMQEDQHPPVVQPDQTPAGSAESAGSGEASSGDAGSPDGAEDAPDGETDSAAGDEAGDEAPEGEPEPAEGRVLTRRERRRARKAALPGKDPVWARLLVVFGAVLVVLSGTVVTGSKVLASRYSNSVHQSPLLGDNSRNGDKEERRSALVGPLNFLLLGSDLRAKDPEDGQRSDSIIIVHVPASLDRAYLLSIPRDLRVKIPAFEPTGFKGATHQKINGAFQYGGGGDGGVQLLAETLTELLGIRFDGAAIVNFDGFKSAVDLLGGVDMCIDQKVTSIHLGYDDNGNYLSPEDGGHPAVYEAGCHHLESWQALDLVRQRKSLANGDFDRQKNQQKFIRAIFDKAQQKDLTTNPFALDKFIRAIGSALTVDTNGVPLEEMMFGLRNVRPSTMLGLQVPSEPQDIGGISYVIALPEAESLYTAIREDTLDSWAVENPTWVNNM